MSFRVWNEPKKKPFAISVSHDTPLDLFIYLGGGQLVKFFSFFPPHERPAGAAQICAVMHEAAGRKDAASLFYLSQLFDISV